MSYKEIQSDLLQVAEKAVKKMAAEKAPMDEATKRVTKTLALLTTVSCTPKDIARLDYYFHSTVRLCVQIRGTLLPEAWFMNGKRNLSETGFSTVQDLAAWLKAHGAREIRKPKPFKFSPPLYD